MIEIRRVLLARVIQRFDLRGPAPYLPDLVRSLGERYAFAAMPASLDLTISDPPKPTEFKHGRFARNGQQTVILNLSLYNDGALIDTDVSTAQTELVVADLLSWAEEQKLPMALVPPRFYISQLELRIKGGGLERLAPGFRLAGRQITKFLTDYGINAKRYDVTSVFVNFDTHEANPNAIQPGPFQLERRAGVPFEEGIYFSQAPLKTPDHIVLLEQLDKL
jgi:hypothetical protein